MICRALAFALISVTMMSPAYAVNPDEILEDPALEARARVVGKELRCLVCQNQSIDDSDADLARDLRVLVRERITQGDSNEEVIDYVVSRYGDFVLLNPPFKLKTYALWFGPWLILVFGVVVIWLFYRRRHTAFSEGNATANSLNEKEARRLKKVMEEHKL
jgi:cytochrome c-type biogenesis protein CcmH